jgi:hypothetical protein
MDVWFDSNKVEIEELEEGSYILHFDGGMLSAEITVDQDDIDDIRQELLGEIARHEQSTLLLADLFEP